MALSLYYTGFMKVIVACEYSGKVRDAFIKQNHYAISCDFLPTELPGPHYQGDIFDILNDGFDLLIAHPPCTYLSNSGVRWIYSQEDRWLKMYYGASFFRKLLRSNIKFIAIENPIPHKYALKLIGERYSQIVQPWQFGHGETKATCLWLKGLPLLKASEIVKGREQKIWNMLPSEDRQKLRSETYQGIADAMAKQWGEINVDRKCQPKWQDSSLF